MAGMIPRLYKRVSRRTQQLQKEWLRGSAHLYEPIELSYFSGHAPEAVLKQAEKFDTPLQPIVREAFKTTPFSPQAMGQALEIYKVLGQRIGVLQRLIYSSTSETVTDDICIKTKSGWIGFGLLGFIFGYEITIKNYSTTKTHQLLTRHWEILDSNGEEVVDGDGVVGQRPELLPGTEYTYQSFCDFKTNIGMMKGSFGMIEKDTQRKWDAIILPFGHLGPKPAEKSDDETEKGDKDKELKKRERGFSSDESGLCHC